MCSDPLLQIDSGRYLLRSRQTRSDDRSRGRGSLALEQRAYWAGKTETPGAAMAFDVVQHIVGVKTFEQDEWGAENRIRDRKVMSLAHYGPSARARS